MRTENCIAKVALSFSLITAVGLGATGCATSPPQATFTHELPKQHLIDRNDAVTVTVDARSGVSVADYERQRLAQLIEQKIDAEKATSAISGERRDYELDVELTRYEKGNAFARAMLAGLGQIHIDAHVTLISLPEKKSIADFDVSKTFAWGGIYGGATSIEDVEPAFAEGIAEAVTQAKAQPKQKDS